MPYHLSPDKLSVLDESGKPVPGGKHKTRGQALAHLRALEVNVTDARKHGQAFNGANADRIQAIHDHAMNMGAACEAGEGGKSILPRARQFAAKYAEAMGMDEDQYAAQECQDVQDACQVLYGLADLARAVRHHRQVGGDDGGAGHVSGDARS